MPAEQKQLIRASQIVAHKTPSAPEPPLSLCYVTDRERRGEWDCACSQNLNTCCFVPCAKLTSACFLIAVMADWNRSNHFDTPCILWNTGFLEHGLEAAVPISLKKILKGFHLWFPCTHCRRRDVFGTLRSTLRSSTTLGWGCLKRLCSTLPSRPVAICGFADWDSFIVSAWWWSATFCSFSSGIL